MLRGMGEGKATAKKGHTCFCFHEDFCSSGMWWESPPLRVACTQATEVTVTIGKHKTYNTQCTHTSAK